MTKSNEKPTTSTAARTVAIRQIGPHTFEATPLGLPPAARVLETGAEGQQARVLAEKLLDAAAALEAGSLSSAARASLKGRVRAASLAFAKHDGTREVEERRFLIIEAIEHAMASPGSAVSVAFGVLQEKLGPVEINPATVRAAIDAWPLKGREHWPPVHALACALGCGAEDLESFRTRFTKLRSARRKKSQ